MYDNTMDKLGRKRVIHNVVAITLIQEGDASECNACIHISCVRCKSKNHNATSCQVNPKVTSTSGSTTSTSNQNKKSDK